MVTPNRVVGIKHSKQSIMLYALSTCIWCKKVKRLLDNLGVSYEFINVDELSAQDKAEAMAEVKRFNPRCTFPTMVVGGSECIVGFKEDRIREAAL